MIRLKRSQKIQESEIIVNNKSTALATSRTKNLLFLGWQMKQSIETRIKNGLKFKNENKWWLAGKKQEEAKWAGIKILGDVFFTLILVHFIYAVDNANWGVS